jgi:hypothetical protein
MGLRNSRFGPGHDLTSCYDIAKARSTIEKHCFFDKACVIDYQPGSSIALQPETNQE